MPPRTSPVRASAPLPLAPRSVKLVPASTAVDTDAGPQVIALDNQLQNLGFGRFNYYLDLADIALARAEQRRIKEKIRPHVERYRQITGQEV